MDALIPFLSPTALILACGIAVLAGLIKGMVGFAMPMILISGLSTFLPPELALAGLILPTFVTNSLQALRQGVAEAWRSILRFRVFLIAGLVCLFISAQLVRVISAQMLLGLIGAPIVLFALMQFLGLRLSLPAQSRGIEAAAGGLAGFIGGLSGVWGPPTVAYLTALDTPKTEHVRVQGVIYGLGAAALMLAHMGSGVLRAETLPFSAILVVPATLGMWVGAAIHDRIDQATFRRATLIVLLIAGLNLMRRAVIG